MLTLLTTRLGAMTFVANCISGITCRLGPEGVCRYDCPAPNNPYIDFKQTLEKILLSHQGDGFKMPCEGMVGNDPSVNAYLASSGPLSAEVQLITTEHLRNLGLHIFDSIEEELGRVIQDLLNVEKEYLVSDCRFVSELLRTSLNTLIIELSKEKKDIRAHFKQHLEEIFSIEYHLKGKGEEGDALYQPSSVSEQIDMLHSAIVKYKLHIHEIVLDMHAETLRQMDFIKNFNLQ